MTFIMITSFGGNALAESDGLSPAEEEYASEEALAGTAEESPGGLQRTESSATRNRRSEA